VGLPHVRRGAGEYAETGMRRSEVGERRTENADVGVKGAIYANKDGDITNELG
jgi:hypothetical protein